ncbi:baseplate hub domain-containing protein [Pseudoalteromonas sp. T1lg65]|uniref:baseplate hub domain-containing protein n=1 Tax=Pseudoalteromonas sp. T1lg65 TaxID=2077101 RepID=UPI003F7B2D36
MSSQLANALSGDYQFCHLLDIEFDWGTLALTDADENIDYNGKTYLAGVFKSFGSVKHSNGIRIGDLKLNFNALDPSVVALGLNERWMNRRVELSKLISTHRGIAGRLSLYKGLISKMDMNTSGSMSYTVSSIWADFEKSAGRQTNTASHQKYFSQTDPFKYTPLLTDAVPWGKEGNGSVKSRSGSGRRSGGTVPRVVKQH